mmetsp:Transcript_44939/g.92937  ORF Transcript_44939/g.92937 Transcript_44939/m.92937 type:complete len:274 (+) Transcript_44939:104-925(+)
MNTQRQRRVHGEFPVQSRSSNEYKLPQSASATVAKGAPCDPEPEFTCGAANTRAPQAEVTKLLVLFGFFAFLVICGSGQLMLAFVGILLLHLLQLSHQLFELAEGDFPVFVFIQELEHDVCIALVAQVLHARHELFRVNLFVVSRVQFLEGFLDFPELLAQEVLEGSHRTFLDEVKLRHLSELSFGDQSFVVDIHQVKQGICIAGVVVLRKILHHLFSCDLTIVAASKLLEGTLNATTLAVLPRLDQHRVFVKLLEGIELLHGVSDLDLASLA